MKVRIARPEDLPSLLTLRCALWPNVDLDHHEQRLHRRFETVARCATMVLENSDGQLCGFVELTRDVPLPGESGQVQLEAVFVTPPMRRKGGAGRLLDAAQRWAHGRGATCLYCDLPFADEQSRDLLRLLGFDEGERRVRATRAVSVPPEVATPRATGAPGKADGAVAQMTPSPRGDGDFEFVAVHKSRSPLALIVNIVLFACAVFAFANTNIYSKDLFRGMVLPLLDIAFVLYFAFLFVAMRYRKRADSRARADQLFSVDE